MMPVKYVHYMELGENIGERTLCNSNSLEPRCEPVEPAAPADPGEKRDRLALESEYLALSKRGKEGEQAQDWVRELAAAYQDKLAAYWMSKFSKDAWPDDEDIQAIQDYFDTAIREACECYANELEQIIPSSFYSERDFTFRFKKLVEQWRRAIEAYQLLGKRTETAERERDEAKTANRIVKENGAFTKEVFEQVLRPSLCGVAGHFEFQVNGGHCMMCQREAVQLADLQRRYDALQAEYEKAILEVIAANAALIAAAPAMYRALEAARYCFDVDTKMRKEIEAALKAARGVMAESPEPR